MQGRKHFRADHICSEMLPALHKLHLIDAVDAFCEGIGFSLKQVEKVFNTAQKMGLRLKLHAEQLSNLHGAAMAARHNALSADHLEYIDEAGVKAMAKAGMTAVLLPGAFYMLHETQLPPVQMFRDNNIPIAIATDHNPGSSPLLSPLIVMNMACTLFRLTPEEALLGMTAHAARALDYTDIGTIEAGKAADLALWDIDHPHELSYWIGTNPCACMIQAGNYMPFS